MSNTIIAGITIGDPNGIGPEIILKSFTDQRILEEITPVIYSPIEILEYYQKKLNLHLRYEFIKNPSKAKAKKINLIKLEKNNFSVEAGKITKEAGAIAFDSLQKATSDLSKNLLDVIVTSPINKDNIQNENFNFLGHTEYFTENSNLKESLMLMVHNELRVGLATNHLSIKKVSPSILQENLFQKLELYNKTLIKDFNISNPKIALLGLNPHAGDNGLIGDEEKNIIIPFIQKAKEKNLLVYGPYAADGFFANHNYLKFDGVLAMYHDQGLIPFKILSNNEGVNFTAGLPIVRTSPDHGTGYNIAGKGTANSASFRNALFEAKDIYHRRKKIKNLTKNRLVLNKEQ